MVIAATGRAANSWMFRTMTPAQADISPLLRIQTFYEGMHLADGRTIRFLKFVLPAQAIDWKAVNLDTDEEAAGREY